MRDVTRIIIIMALLMAVGKFDSVAMAQFDDEMNQDEGDLGGNETSAPEPEPSAPPEAKPEEYRASGEATRDEIRKLSSALKGGDKASIINAASRILSKDSRNLEALNALAVFYINTQKYGMANIILNRAIEHHPKEPALHNNMGVVWLGEGDQRKAIASFRRALELKSNYLIGAMNLSSIYLEGQDYSRALAPLEDGYGDLKADLRRGDRSALEVANNYAIALQGSGSPDKSKKIFQIIMESESRNPEIMLNYAILLVDVLKDKSSALPVISRLKFLGDELKSSQQVRELEKRAEAL